MPKRRRLEPGDRAGRLMLIKRRERVRQRVASMREGGAFGVGPSEQLDDLDATAVVGADLESLKL